MIPFIMLNIKITENGHYSTAKQLKNVLKVKTRDGSRYIPLTCRVDRKNTITDCGNEKFP